MPVDTINLHHFLLKRFTFHFSRRSFLGLHSICIFTIGTSRGCNWIVSFDHICYKVKPFFPFFFPFYFLRLSGNLWLAFNPDICNEVLFASGKVKRRVIWQSEARFFSKEIVHNVLFRRLVHCHEQESLDLSEILGMIQSAKIHQYKHTIGRVLQLKRLQRVVSRETWLPHDRGLHTVTSQDFTLELFFVTVFLRGNQTCLRTSFHLCRGS